MSVSANEQYILELINRGRLDPQAEAARYGIDLNQGLARGTISAESKQVVAYNAQLEDAATGHSNWMLASNRFSHTGQGGSSIFERITDAGYDFVGPLQTFGENLSWGGNTAGINLNEQAQVRYDNLFNSASHRTNTLNGTFREVGLGHEEGNFTSGGTTYRSSMLTENFATSGTEYFLTGVAYNDRNGNDFYGIGEGRSGVQITADGQSATTASAGGYTIGMQPDVTTSVTIRASGDTLARLTVDLSDHNVKLDVINTNGEWDLALSGNATLQSGIADASLLGLDDLYLVGHTGNNALSGNAGDNRLNGQDGNDYLFGGAGHDVLIDGAGSDALVGGRGRDTFTLVGDGDLDRINDFSLELDRIDLRGWNGANALKDLSITSTSTGARIEWQSETLVVKSASNQSISASSLTDDVFMFGNAPSVARTEPAPSMQGGHDLAGLPSGGTERIEGNHTNNYIVGTSGNDFIFGYRGNDILDGKGGADTMFGSTGNDTYVVNHANDRIGGEASIAQGGSRGDTVKAWTDYILPDHVEILRLQGRREIDGGGNDQNNRLFGSRGDNLLDGGAGNDRLRGDAGDDVIIGGAGKDRMWGGGGADTFLFAKASDSRVGGANRDNIHKFESGKDLIDLSYMDADTLRGGHQSFDFIGTDAFSGNGFSSAGELRFFAANGRDLAVVAIDQNGDGAADLQINVRNIDTLTADDFIL